ncbi:uclacyanin 1-like [Impatiens glandulifera]|uniref:uclacyanin 1-like n=1 Tax=Impatiens glandulifera TaxID=253017 RepID=UPI001FB0FEDB|nr:uclacyanin 1-like [Impatiens glandulifera]
MTKAVKIMKKMVLFMIALVITISIVRATAYDHVVGDDRGWDPATRLSGWSSGRTFKVGDKIWFAYSAALESIVEVGSREEYETCDVSNPIRMYTDGLNSVSLEEEGNRYFASGKEESCKNGLKLKVEVRHPLSSILDIPTTYELDSELVSFAQGPAATSGTTHLTGGTTLVILFLGILLLQVGLF